MANTAQLVNNLHCLFLANKENFIVTPTYHVYDMYKEHQGATAIKTAFEQETITYKNPDNQREEKLAKLSVSASVKDDALLLTVANLSLTDAEDLELESVGMTLGNDADITILRNDDVHAHNTFDAPDAVTPIQKTAKADVIQVPPASVVTARIKLQ
jgi:alpha-N-arabinofuranosidase